MKNPVFISLYSSRFEYNRCMYCTQNNIIRNTPKTDKTRHTDRYITYPHTTGGRIAEGGLRTKGAYKSHTKKHPLLSIITVVYNGAKNIERCIQSVLHQNYDNVEYIIIDGGSTDGTMDIVKTYEEAIDYFVSEPDGGIYDAMNKGIALAQGGAINFMNADDYFIPDVFQDYVDHLFSDCNKECKVVYAATNVTDAQGNILFVNETRVDSILFGAILSHQSIFVKKEIFEKIDGFDTSYKIAGDYDFLLSIYLQYGSASFRYIDAPTVFFELSGASVLMFNKNIIKEEMAQIRMKKLVAPLGLPIAFFEAVGDYPVSVEGLEKAILMLNDKIYHIDEYEEYYQTILLDMMKALLSLMPDRLHYINEKINVLECNRYYRFGQMSKMKKIKTVLSFPMRIAMKCICKIFRK